MVGIVLTLWYRILVVQSLCYLLKVIQKVRNMDVICTEGCVLRMAGLQGRALVRCSSTPALPAS